jgi:hypothetical protein
VKKLKTQGQMLADFSEAVIAKRESEKASYPEIPKGCVAQEAKMPPYHYQQPVTGLSVASFTSACLTKPKAPAIPEGFFPYCFETGGPVYNIPQGFIPHDGGPCPVADGTLFTPLFRYGVVGPSSLAPTFSSWRHRKDELDIIAYRIERSPDFRVELSRFYIDAEGQRARIVMRINDRVIAWPNKEYWHNGDGVYESTPPLLALAADQTSPMVSA